MKHTEEIQRERTETYTEEKTFWTCDNCQLTKDEHEVVSVAIDPETGGKMLTPGEISLAIDKAKNDIQTGKRVKVDDRYVADRISEHLRRNIDGWMGYKAAETADVCVDCIEESYGIELETTGDMVDYYELRNYSEGLSLPEAAFLITLICGLVGLSTVSTSIMLGGSFVVILIILFWFTE